MSEPLVRPKKSMGAAPGLALLVVCLAAPSPAQTANRAEQWRQDLDFFAERLKAGHPNLFFKVTEEEYSSALAALRVSISDSTDYEMAVGLARVVSLVGDAHTTVNVLGSVRFYPLRVQWFQEGLFAIQSSLPNARAIGQRVVRINDVPVDEVYGRIGAIIPHENEPWLRATSPLYFVSPEILHALRVIPESGPARYTFESADGGTFSLEVAPASAALVAGPHLAQPRNPYYRRNPALNYWFAYLEDFKTIYLQYNVCQEAPLLPFGQFLSELGSFAQRVPVERFVLDLRNNSGGASTVIQPLVAAVAAAPRLARGLYVITGRLTFSSGMLAAIDFKRLGGILAGEATGGKPHHYGNVQTFVLPNSRLSVQHSTKRFTFDDIADTSSLEPDIPVELSIQDWLEDRDPFLDAILRR